MWLTHPCEASSAHPGGQPIQERAGVSPSPAAAQPPATSRHRPDTLPHLARRTVSLSLKRTFFARCRSTRDAARDCWCRKQGWSSPAPPLCHHHPSLAHRRPGQLTVTKKQHWSMELQMFPTSTSNTLCCTSCLSPHSFLENSVLEMIRDKNLNGCGPELYVSNSHLHQNRSYF